MKKYITTITLLTPIIAQAGDSKIFWRIGEIDNLILFYLDNDKFFVPQIPTKIFFSGVLISIIGLCAYPLTRFIKKKEYHLFLSLFPLVSTLGAFIFTSLFGWIARRWFHQQSAAIFWSWYTFGALFGGIMFFIIFLKILVLNRKITKSDKGRGLVSPPHTTGATSFTPDSSMPSPD